MKAQIKKIVKSGNRTDSYKVGGVLILRWQKHYKIISVEYKAKTDQTTIKYSPIELDAK